jgi:hypothetical protein
MIAIARGSIAEPDKLGPFIDDGMRVVRRLKDEGFIKALYRRAAGPGVLIISKDRAWTPSASGPIPSRSSSSG